jgi:hypothetical protein
MENMHLLIGQKIHVNCQLMEAGREGLIFTEFARGNVAFRASPPVSAGHENLLRVIANKISENWVAPAPHTVATLHSHTSFPRHNDRM